MKRVILIACSIIVAIGFIIPVFAVFGESNDNYERTESRFTYIDNCSASISKGLLSTTVSADITGKTGVTKVKIKMELQKLSDGSYTTVETWEQTFNSITGSMSESKLTNPLSTYRLKATVTAYCGSNSESQTLYRYD